MIEFLTYCAAAFGWIYLIIAALLAICLTILAIKTIYDLAKLMLTETLKLLAFFIRGIVKMSKAIARDFYYMFKY